MRIQHYCYTRGTQMDYNDFVKPDNVSNDFLTQLRNKAKSILDDKNIERNLDIPKWLLVKTNHIIAWGCCCNNAVLSRTHFLDHVNRNIRGFFAIVISDFDSSVKLPFDLDYFKQLYEKEIVSYWNQYEPHGCKVDKYVIDDFDAIIPKETQVRDKLNIDSRICYSLGNIDKKEAIANALTLETISLLIDNDNIEQAINSSGSFMNCISNVVPKGRWEIKVGSQCSQCGKQTQVLHDGLCTSCKNLEREKQKNDKIMMEKLNEELQQTKVENERLQKEINILERELSHSKKVFKIVVGAFVVIILLIGLKNCKSWSPNPYKKGVTLSNVINIS